MTHRTVAFSLATILATGCAFKKAPEAQRSNTPLTPKETSGAENRPGPQTGETGPVAGKPPEGPPPEPPPIPGLMHISWKIGADPRTEEVNLTIPGGLANEMRQGARPISFPRLPDEASLELSINIRPGSGIPTQCLAEAESAQGAHVSLDCSVEASNSNRIRLKGLVNASGLWGEDGNSVEIEIVRMDANFQKVGPRVRFSTRKIPTGSVRFSRVGVWQDQGLKPQATASAALTSFQLPTRSVPSWILTELRVAANVRHALELRLPTQLSGKLMRRLIDRNYRTESVFCPELRFFATETKRDQTSIETFEMLPLSGTSLAAIPATVGSGEATAAILSGDIIPLGIYLSHPSIHGLLPSQRSIVGSQRKRVVEDCINHEQTSRRQGPGGRVGGIEPLAGPDYPTPPTGQRESDQLIGTDELEPRIEISFPGAYVRFQDDGMRDPTTPWASLSGVTLSWELRE